MEEQEVSPVIQFLRIVWQEQGFQMTRSRSRFDYALREALRFAIRYGFKFERDDFKMMCKRYHDGGLRFGLWGCDIERYYSLACGVVYVVTDQVKVMNRSACLAIENHLNRLPFIVKEPSHKKGGRRIAINSWFSWRGEMVKCTSFKGYDSMIACSYQIEQERLSNKVKRRYSITKEDLLEANRLFLSSLQDNVS